MRLVVVSESALRDGHPAIDLLAPLSRLGGIHRATVGAVRAIRRIPYANWADQHPTRGANDSSGAAPNLEGTTT